MKTTSMQKMILMTALLVSSNWAEQLLVNNDFSSGMSGWASEGSGFTATAGSDQWGNFVQVKISNGGTNPWDVKLQQGGITLEPGYEYTLEWGASRASGSISVGLGMATEPYTAFMSDQITFSGDYTEHSTKNGSAVTLHYCDATVSNLRFYFDMGGSNESAKIAWASLGKEKKDCGGSGGELTNPGNGPVPYYGELKVSGNKIIGARSKAPVQVRGMSLYWSVWGGERFYNADAVRTLVTDWKIEVVRAAMGVNVDGGYVGDPAGQQALVEKVIQAAIDQEIYVIVDFHSHQADQYSAQAKAFFGAIAQKYGKYDNVIFEVFNEPLAISWGTIRSYAEGVISEIRKYSDNLVIVGTSNWSQDVDQVTKINDPNTAYTLHFYAGTHGADLRAKASSALGKGLALFVTEWGTVNSDGDGGVATTSSNEWMSFMDQNKLSWANWSLNDKNEGASVFQNGISTTGSGWTNWSNLTASGQYVYTKLTGYAGSARWRTAPKQPSAIRLQNRNELDVEFFPGGYSLGGAKDHVIQIVDMQGRELFQEQRNGGLESYKLPKIANGGKGAMIVKLRRGSEVKNQILR